MQLHPRLWPSVARWSVAVTIAALVMPVDLFSTIYTGAQSEIVDEFGTSYFLATLGVGLVNLGTAFGPVLGAPLSELFGRRPIYTVACTGFTCFASLSALSTNIHLLLACRFLAALFGTAVYSNFPGSLSDMFTPEDRAPFLALCNVVLQGVPALGPVVGTYIAYATSWRWVVAVPAVWAAVASFPLMFVPETKSSVIAAREESRLQGKPVHFFTAALPENTSPVRFWSTALLTPLIMLCREPILLITSVYHTFVYGLLFILSEGYPYTFRTMYNFDVLQTRIVFLSPALGNVLGALAYFLYLRYWSAKPLTAEDADHTDPSHHLDTNVSSLPEKTFKFQSPDPSPLPTPDQSFLDLTRVESRHSLSHLDSTPAPNVRPPKILILATVLVSIGLFWFALTASSPQSIHPLVPIASGIPTGAGISLFFLSLFNYYIDLYPERSASALAGNILIRHLATAWFPSFALPMFKTLGVRNAGLVLAGISLIGLPGGWMLWFYGGRTKGDDKNEPAPDKPVDVESEKGLPDQADASYYPNVPTVKVTFCLAAGNGDSTTSPSRDT